MSVAEAELLSRELRSLELEAAAALKDALAQTSTLHLPGARELHRQRLERAIQLAEHVLAMGAVGGATLPLLAAAKHTLARALAARAIDARHGAGQLAQGSQRAPTAEACEDGWQRVGSIVAVCERSAREATRLAVELNTPLAHTAARAAVAAAREARELLEARNHAYTFHADPAFSFGEGWYVAAAGTLAGVTIQVEPDKPQTAQAEQFLRDAGLGSSLVPYRSRPRANKALPELVAQAFRAEPRAAQAALRAAFLGAGPVSPRVVEWSERSLLGSPTTKKVLLWIRDGVHHPTRNTTYPELLELCARARASGLLPVLVGDALRLGEVPTGAWDLTLFWRHPVFQALDMRRAQLQLFEYLRTAHGLVGQLGVTTAGMDGPALMGLPTMYLTQLPNVRLGRWVGAVPDYEEVVRIDGYLERVSRTLQRWADTK